jgi:spore germination protein GerM
MEEKDKNLSLSPKLIVSVAVIILAAGSVTAWWANNSLNSSRNDHKIVPSDNISSTPNQTQATKEKEKVEIYWLDDNLELFANPITVPKANDKSKLLENAFLVLLAGPTDSSYGTTIPEGTQLIDLSIDPEGVHINLSEEFTSGGGSASMIGRLGQIIYTASSFEPNVSVWISVEGKPLAELGGEGLLVEQPMTRELFTEFFTF